MRTRVGSVGLPACLILLSLGPASRAGADDMVFDPLRDWVFYNNTGWLYMNKGDYASAELRFHAAIKAVKPQLKTDNRLMARSYHDLALVLYYQKRYDEAEPLARWSLTARENNKAVKPESVYQSAYMLGLIQTARRRYPEAETLFKRAVALQEKALGPDDPASAPTYENLATVYREQGKYAEAEPFYRQAVALQEQQRPEGNPDLADTFDHFAVMLRRMKRAEEAEALESRAKAIREAVAERAAEKSSKARGEGGPEGFQPPRPARRP